MEWERQEEIHKIKEKEDRIKKEFERRMNPRTKEDFDLLYHALESKFFFIVMFLISKKARIALSKEYKDVKHK